MSRSWPVYDRAYWKEKVRRDRLAQRLPEEPPQEAFEELARILGPALRVPVEPDERSIPDE